MNRALIFDFNGTLFWDTPMNAQAWCRTAQLHRGTPFSPEELALLNGRTNRQTVEYLLGGTATNEQVLEISQEKEYLYKEICLGDPQRLHLAPGATTLLEYCRQTDIPIAIATSCGKGNLDLYIEWFGLLRWFTPQHITYDRGLFAGKPAPDVYIAAAQSIARDPAHCIVFEDTASGIKSAVAARIGEIWAVGSEGADIETTSRMEHVAGVVTDFGDVLGYMQETRY